MLRCACRWRAQWVKSPDFINYTPTAVEFCAVTANNQTFQPNTPAPSEALASLRAALKKPLPDDYLAFLQRANGGEGFIGERYVRLWKAEELIEANRGYDVAEFFCNLFLIGTDDGGEAYAFDVSGNDAAVFEFPLIGMPIGVVQLSSIAVPVWMIVNWIWLSIVPLRPGGPGIAYLREPAIHSVAARERKDFMVPIPYPNKVTSLSRDRRIGDHPVLGSPSERQRSEVGNRQCAARWEIRKIRNRHRAAQKSSRRTAGIAINTEIYLIRAGAIVLQCGTNLREMGIGFWSEGQGDFKGRA